MLSRSTIRSIYYHTFFFGFFFRFFLIRYADRGLVKDGLPQLELFNKLYWVVFTAYVSVGMAHPITTIIKGTFFKFQKLKVCLRLPVADANDPNRPNSSSGTFAIMSPFLCMCMCCFCYYRVKRYIKGLCPKKQLSCIGRYRRNIINFYESFYMMCLWSSNPFLEVGMIQFMNLSPVSIFWSYNIMTFFFLDILHGLLFPLFITIFVKFEQPREIRLQKFYVRRAVVLDPRRYYYGKRIIQPKVAIPSTSNKTTQIQNNIYEIVPFRKSPPAPLRQQISLSLLSPSTPLKKTSRHQVVTVHRDHESDSDWEIDI